ncbi:hypothetical protein B0O80DRAFT_463157 [Mortierella sp. GBAus27b]|nr:hypothetical protein B0O80DRAFT_463157 [Mortierella sp. GBAus27b]
MSAPVLSAEEASIDKALESDSSPSKLLVAVPSKICSEEYNKFSFAALHPTYYVIKDGERCISQELPSTGRSILMTGLGAKAPCDHEECFARSWCVKTGRCSHTTCSLYLWCKLRKIRLGPHCGHPTCPSLLECQFIKHAWNRPDEASFDDDGDVGGAASVMESCPGGGSICIGCDRVAFCRTTLKCVHKYCQKDKPCRQRFLLIPGQKPCGCPRCDQRYKCKGGRPPKVHASPDSDDEFHTRPRNSEPLRSPRMGPIKTRRSSGSSVDGSVRLPTPVASGLSSSTSSMRSASVPAPPSSSSSSSSSAAAAAAEAEAMLRNGERTNLPSVQEEDAVDQIDSVFDLDDDFDGHSDVFACDTIRVSKNIVSQEKSISDVVSGVGLDGLSRSAGKRLAVESDASAPLEHQEKANGPAMGVGSRPVAMPARRRLLSMIRRLGREHLDDVALLSELFVAHHEGRLDGAPFVSFETKPRTSSEMELDARIADLERDIRFGMDMYHTLAESKGLGECTSLKERPVPWFSGEDSARPSKRPAL